MKGEAHAVVHYESFPADHEHHENIHTDLFNRIVEAVSECPVLAKTVTPKGYSLLKAAVEVSSPLVHPSIKFLIEKNPTALIWPGGDSLTRQQPLATIAGDRCHYTLMPWIAEKIPFVFDASYDKFQEEIGGSWYPSHTYMTTNCKQPGEDQSLIRQFYEVYPQGLRQGCPGGLPIHIYLSCVWEEPHVWNEPEIDIVKFMVDQNPTSLRVATLSGEFPLHVACFGLIFHPTDTMAEVCLHLASKCPEAIPIFRSDGLLPIQILSCCINRPAVQKVALAFLRWYPGIIDAPECRSLVNDEFSPAPKDVPFLRDVHTFVVEEIAVQKEVDPLANLSAPWLEGVKLCNNDRHIPVADAYENWLELRTAQLQNRLEQIHELVTEVGLKYQGEGPFRVAREIDEGGNEIIVWRQDGPGGEHELEL